MELYPEFKPIYICMGVILALLVIITILIITVLVKLGKRTRGKDDVMYMRGAGTQPLKNVAFCKNCATRFDTSEKCCPKCGTLR